MLIESCQLLAVAYPLDRLAQYDVPRSQSGKPRRHFNPKHGCCRWIVASKANWDWVLKHAAALAAEYRHRFGRTHFCEGFVQWCRTNPPELCDVGLTPPYLAMDEEYKRNNFVEAYRNYYRLAKKVNKRGQSMFKWTRREQPSWVR